MASERDEIEQREQEMRVLVEKSEEKRAWFSSFREWLESVAGFLDEKVSDHIYDGLSLPLMITKSILH